MILANNHNSAIADAIAAIVALFNPAGGAEAYMILFKNNVTVGPGTRIADLTEADFDGYVNVAVAAGAAQTGINPSTGQWEIRPKEPAGGFQFPVTDNTMLPMTIYGYALVNHAKTILIASANFAEPKVLTATGMVVDVPQPTLTLAFVPLT